MAFLPMDRAATKPANKEKRKFPRLPISIPLFVRGVDASGKEFLEFATALNISASGVLLAVRRSLSATGIVELEIPVVPLPPAEFASHSVRRLTAKLVRVTHGDRCHMVGLKFLRPLTP